MQQTTTDLKEKYENACNFYDTKFYDLNLISFLKLVVYIPFGVLLLFARFLILNVLYLLVNIMPSLQFNKIFIRIVCLTLGIFTSHSNRNKSINNNSIYVCNHVTSLDYIAIKSIINASSYQDSNNNNNARDSLLLMFFKNILQINNLEKINQSIFFPELTTTNGAYGLLKFSTQPFDLINQDSSYSCVPVCVRVNRSTSTLIPFKLNYIHWNELTHILIGLFVPYTHYDLVLLNEVNRNENETSEQFAQRIQTLIGSELKLKCTDITYESLKQTFKNYKQYLEQQNRLRNQEINSAGGGGGRRRNVHRSQPETSSVSFSDISRVALQIKDILPDVSFETIKQHINLTASLDIDTVIASILDSNSFESTTTTNNNNKNNTTDSATAASSGQTRTSQKSNFKNNNSYISYEERKFTLLNEARQRYLAKQNKK